MNAADNVETMRDDELIEGLRRLRGYRNRLEARMLEYLIEVDRRRLYAREGHSSLFRFCTEALGLSEDEAGKRIHAARSARRVPQVLAYLRTGRLHLTGLCLLAPHLTPDNHQGLLEAAAGKSKRAIAELVADLAPRPDVPASIRKLPSRSAPTPAPVPALHAPQPAPAPATGSGRKPGGSSEAAGDREASDGPAGDRGAGRDDAGGDGGAGSDHARMEGATEHPAHLAADRGGTSPGTAPASAPPPRQSLSTGTATVDGASAAARPTTRPAIEPLGQARYKVQFTASPRLRDKLQRAQDLSRHADPMADLPSIIEQALDLFIAQRERRKFGKTTRPVTRRPNAATASTAAPANDAQPSKPAVADQIQASGDAPMTASSAEVPKGKPAVEAAAADQLPATANGPSAASGTEHREPQAAGPRTATGTEHRVTQAVARRTRAGTEHRETQARYSRYVSSAVKREVHERDGGRCTFVSPTGVQCGETAFLEYAHRHAHALGGPPTAANLALRCSAHNAFEAEAELGRDFIAQKRREAPKRRRPDEPQTQRRAISPPIQPSLF